MIQVANWTLINRKASPSGRQNTTKNINTLVIVRNAVDIGKFWQIYSLQLNRYFSVWLQWEQKFSCTFFCGLIVDRKYTSACWSRSGYQREERSKIIWVLGEVAIHCGAQGKFVFRLMFDKKDLFQSIPNSEERTDFTLGIPSVKHSCSILSADFSVFNHINTLAAVYVHTSMKHLIHT